MSTEATQPTPAPAAPAPEHRREIVIVSHSSLFYWWPVWAVGYLMALISMVTSDVLVPLPPGSKIYDDAKTVKIAIKDAKEGEYQTFDNRDVIVAGEKTD